MIATAITCLILLSPQDPPLPTTNPGARPGGRPATQPGAQQPGTKADAGPALALSELLPQDTLFAVSMPALGSQMDEFLKTGTGHLFGTFATAWSHAKLMSRFEDHGLSPVDLRALTTNGFSFAVTSIDWRGSANWVFVGNTAGRGNALRQALAKAHRTLESQGTAIRTEVVHNSKVWTLTTQHGQKLTYTVHGETAVVGDSFGMVEDTLNRKARSKSSLADAVTYQRFARQCAADGAPLLALFAQPHLIVKALLEQVPPNFAGIAKEGLDQLQINKISEFGLSFVAKDGQLTDYAWLGYPGPRTGLLSVLLGGNHRVDPQHCNVVATDCTTASLFHLDVKKIYTEGLNLARLFDPSIPQSAKIWIQGLKNRTDVDLNSDFLDRLDNRAVFQQWTATGKNPETFAFTLQVANGTVVRKALQALAKEFRIRTNIVAGAPAFILAGVVPNLDSGLVFVYKDYLVVTDSAFAADRIVATIDAGTGNPEVRKALASLPARPTSFGWGDCAKIGRQWLRKLSVEFGNRKAAEKLVDIVEKTGGSLVSELQTTPDGVLARSRSPFGNLYLSLGAAYFLDKEATSWLERVIAKGGQTETQKYAAILGDIVTAEHEFSRMIKKDADHDKAGEYGTIQELVAARLLNKKHFATPTGKGSYEWEGRQFEVFLPKDVDEQESAFLVLTWPAGEKTGLVFGATPSGAVYGNKVIAHSEGIAHSDPRDFYHLGYFGGEVLPTWDRITTAAPQVTKPEPKPDQLSVDEEEALDLILRAEKDRDVTPRIIGFLEAQNPLIAARAAYALGQLRHKKAVPQLCAIVNEYDNVEVKRQAMAALGRIRHKRSLKTSMDALSSRDEVIRSLAAQNLGFLHAKTAKDKLLEMLSATTGSDAPDRIAGLVALADLGMPDCLVTAAASVKRPGDKDSEALVYLFQTLSSRLEPLSEAKTLIAVLDSESELLRRYAIQRLGVLKEPSSVKALEGRLAKETTLQDLIEVSLDVIRKESHVDNSGGGFLFTVKKKSVRAWQSTKRWWTTLDDTKQYGIAGGGVALLLVLLFWRRSRRKRRLHRDGEAMAAMVAPSDEFATEESYDDVYDEEDEEDEEDDAYDESYVG